MRNAPRLIDRLLRPAATAVRRLVRKARPRSGTSGAHAVALTPAGAVILVKLRYAPGWRLPGGGRDAGEDLSQAALRELREEIGMTAHGSVRPAGRDHHDLVIVEDVDYRPPRWSWEVESVIEAPLERLPPDLSGHARRSIDASRSDLKQSSTGPARKKMPGPAGEPGIL